MHFEGFFDTVKMHVKALHEALHKALHYTKYTV